MRAEKLAGVAGFGKLLSTARQKSLRFSPSGIRTAANANSKIDAGANRPGASPGVAIVR